MAPDYGCDKCMKTWGSRGRGRGGKEGGELHLLYTRLDAGS